LSFLSQTMKICVVAIEVESEVSLGFVKTFTVYSYDFRSTHIKSIIPIDVSNIAVIHKIAFVCLGANSFTLPLIFQRFYHEPRVPRQKDKLPIDNKVNQRAR